MKTNVGNDIPELTRQAMRRFASSVSVVSTMDADEQFYAMTATSVTSLSLEPPSLLVCVNEWAAIHNPLRAGCHFCINILSQEQQAIAEMCSTGPEDRNRLTVGDWKITPGETPYLCDAQANLFCINDKSICYASHTVFIGRVEHVLLHGQVSPLVYLDGQYLNSSGMQQN